MALEIGPKPAIHNFNFTGDYFATFLCKYVVCNGILFGRFYAIRGKNQKSHFDAICGG